MLIEILLVLYFFFYIYFKSYIRAIDMVSILFYIVTYLNSIHIRGFEKDLPLKGVYILLKFEKLP